jgi:GNAT superfamily N-acetyltransferase
MHLAFARKIFLLWHREEPIGICAFAAPAASLSLRSKYFGLAGARSGLAMQAMNRQLWLLSRVVLQPTWRGAGVAVGFVNRACELCPVPWIETLSAMGQINPFFEQAGFQRVGIIRKEGNSQAYRKPLRAESRRKSRFSEPVYYIRDNRRGIPNAGQSRSIISS